jgi:heat shock protein HslJ
LVPGPLGPEPGKLSFATIVSTKRACADEAATRQEQRYLGALESAAGFRLEGNRLTISYDEGRGSLNFVKA